MTDTQEQKHPGKEALAKIVAGLDGVTPGPWSHDNQIANSAFFDDCINGAGGLCIAFSDSPDTAHIARCDPDTILTIAAYVSELEAENAKLREALEPFALFYQSADEHHSLGYLDEYADALPVWGWGSTSNIITYGHFRRARAALSTAPTDGETI